ncbi:MAG: sigma-70 family RNA polymerase sigma factor [Clostridiales bacterium]|nr:sigma-70 family RNA polymerase sigma factor [Clostridiales bacterium]
MQEDNQSRIKEEILYGDEDTSLGKDKEEFEIESLIQDYGNDVLRVAYMYVKDKDVAQDVFQDVFLKVSKNLDTFRGASSIKTWLIRITINTSKDYLKSAWTRRVFPISDHHERTLKAKDLISNIEREETNKIIRATVMELPGKYKDVILCFYFLDMSIKEIAQALNVKEGTVKSRLSRAKIKLKEKLEGRI